MFRKKTAGICLGFSMLTAFAAAAQLPTPTPPLGEQRKLNMQRMGTEAARLGTLLRSPDLSGVVGPSNALYALAKEMKEKELYAWGSGSPDSNAIPAVFGDEKWTDFQGTIDRFIDVADALRNAAPSGGREFRTAAATVFEHCASCHAAYVKGAK